MADTSAPSLDVSAHSLEKFKALSFISFQLSAIVLWVDGCGEERVVASDIHPSKIKRSISN
ncbi:hypothetical protein [Algoriphagus aquimarinus]|uniref:hypothetical protein n=1 Tax=Algoriphagus aquimarinus TaxID=237018 RepID=UPI0011BE289D|nr:hypothetical protein [Algoriphagus aquimarinus]